MSLSAEPFKVDDLQSLFAKVCAAHERIRGVAHRTPIVTSRTADRMARNGNSLYFKCENLQIGGAFKIRGALNHVKTLSPEEKARGVVTHSSGNHAQALALASTMMGVKSYIVMPSNSPQVKVDGTKGYGGEVTLCEPNIKAREETASVVMKKHGAVMVHPYDNPRVIVGAGTAAKELIEDCGKLDVIIAPVGGGGLLSGTAITTKALLPGCKVIGAEPLGADDAFRSFKSGARVTEMTPNTIADGLRTTLGVVNFELIQRYVDDIVTVTEDEIYEAQRVLWERMKLVVEPSGAVSFAVALKICREGMFVGKRVGLILSGGNTSFPLAKL
eukprot:TRINITY_DN7040_c0_g1_i1.p1 TRINITY_DN7040_c0_g1~~TRINITY_DN7040_c0_g1_i1.p1  ORF type:complete len:330 (+),score=66.92 TRINITY_DN7040_c0_g1_i1:54-1043(+)